jgi:hypothetical protein
MLFIICTVAAAFIAAYTCHWQQQLSVYATAAATNPTNTPIAATLITVIYIITNPWQFPPPSSHEMGPPRQHSSGY